MTNNTKTQNFNIPNIPTPMVSNIEYWDLFAIWELSFGIYSHPTVNRIREIAPFEFNKLYLGHNTGIIYAEK